MLAYSLQNNETWMWLMIYWIVLASIMILLMQRWMRKEKAKKDRDIAFKAEWDRIKSDVEATKDFTQAIDYALAVLYEAGVEFKVELTDNYPGCDAWTYTGALDDVINMSKLERRRRYGLVRDVGWSKENEYSWVMSIGVTKKRNPNDDREPVVIQLSGQQAKGADASNGLDN